MVEAGTTAPQASERLAVARSALPHAPLGTWPPAHMICISTAAFLRP
jgi:hypothetical protein